jgi:hypothetical protein
MMNPQRIHILLMYAEDEIVFWLQNYHKSKDADNDVLAEECWGNYKYYLGKVNAYRDVLDG